MTLDAILTAVKLLPEHEQITVLAKIVRCYAAAHPDREIAIVDDENQPVAYCVPNALYRPYIPQEMLAEMKRRAANPGPMLTWADLKAKMERLAAEQERVA